MRFEVQGTVTCGDKWRCMVNGTKDGAIFIGNSDIIDEIHERGWGESVKAFINGNLVGQGKAFTELGWAYSEYTPMDDDECIIGDTNLIEFLEKLEGKEVTLVITDEE